jgi:hypothetical protein
VEVWLKEQRTYLANRIRLVQTPAPSKKKKNNKDQNEVYIKILYTNIEITVSNKVHIEHIF